MLNNEKGVTLIEVLASVAILSIVIIAYTNISNYTLFANQKSTNSVKALQIAEEQLGLAREYFRVNQTLPTDKVEDGYSIAFDTTNLSNESTYDGTEWSGKHISLQGVVADNTRSKIITVTVSWSD